MKKSNKMSYLEEGFAGACVQSAIFNPRLFDKVVSWLDRRQHSLDGEERRQVGCVRWDEY